MAGPRVAIVTLGCKVNAYDSATIGDRLRAAGCAVVGEQGNPDVVVVNSCTVTDAAAAETRALARRMRRASPHCRIVLTGCYAQASPDEAAAVAGIDHVIGVGRLDDLVAAVVGPPGGTARVAVAPSRAVRPFSTFGARRFPGQTRAFLKVQEGCDLFCTFCIVPMARGRSRSLAPRQVCDEVAGLAAAGFEEVVLTAVHLGGYGSDLTPRTDLAELVEMLAERRLVPRLRLTSIDPREVTERLVRVMAAAPDVCDHLHVPLQAGDDGVLRAMRRRYDTVLARERLAMARELLPAAQLGTDLIAGFPGEDAAAHERTLRFLSESPLTYAHVFAYSPRQGTTAAKISGRPTAGVARARAGELRAFCDGKAEAFLRGFEGTLGEVLVERVREPRTGRLRGYTRNYTRVVFDGPGRLAGRRVLVRLALGSGRVMAGQVAA